MLFSTLFFFVFIPIVVSISLISKYALSSSQGIVPVLILFIIFSIFVILILKNNNDLTITQDGVIHLKNYSISLESVKNIHPIQEYSHKATFNFKKRKFKAGPIAWQERRNIFGNEFGFPVYINLHDETHISLGYMTEEEINELNTIISKHFQREMIYL